MKKFILALALLSGCPDGAPGVAGPVGPSGPPGPANLAVISGSQVVVQYMSGSDGSRVFLQLYDKRSELPCTYKLAGDGKQRCLPSLPLVTCLFIDTACTQLACASVVDAPLTTGSLVQYEQVGSSSTFVGLVQDNSPAHYDNEYYDSGSGCTVLSPSGDALYLVNEFPPSNFVEGTITQ